MPSQPPRVLQPCGLYIGCVECTADPHCGWRTGESTQSCELGTEAGPLLKPEEDLLDWQFSVCANAVCKKIVDCAQCALHEKCGYCGGTQKCMDGPF